ncbi:MAG: hypothetical protein ACAF42_00650 [Limnothrix sp. BL-A-16]
MAPQSWLLGPTCGGSPVHRWFKVGQQAGDGGAIDPVPIPELWGESTVDCSG